jgi:hypothetical protein
VSAEELACNRLLLGAPMDDVSATDDLFRILMGDKVEPRHEFIEKHALEARNLDLSRRDMVWDIIVVNLDIKAVKVGHKSCQTGALVAHVIR